MANSGTAKKKALDLMRGLPAKASWDDIVYELYVRKKIDAGLAAAIAGKVISHDEVKRRILRPR